MSLRGSSAHHIYADRVILHNPIETGDKHVRSTRPDFVNPRTGILLPKDSIYYCQLYNFSGHLYRGIFYNPENGHIMELLHPENIDEVDIFADLQEQNNNYKISKMDNKAGKKDQ
jgi:hypothetical protein